MLGPLRPRISPPARIAHVALALVAAPMFLLAALLGNLTQVLSLLAYPFSRRAFLWLNRCVAFSFWSLCNFYLERVNRSRVYFSGDELPPGENVMLVANHQQMPDIVVLMSIAVRKGRLGDMKWFVKDVLKYVPGIGWGMLFLNCIFLKRDWMADRAKIEATFARLVDSGMPFWMCAFSEGTRIKPAKLAAAQAYARTQGVPEPRNVLIPRPRGFAASLTGLGPRLDAVYDVTIGYEDGVPTLGQYLQGLLNGVHLHVRRYPLGELPADEAGRSKWLLERFREKDQLLEDFYRDGQFPGERRVN